MIYQYGDIIHLKNKLPCRVLYDPGGEYIFVAVILSGFLDPHKWIAREDIIKEANEQNHKD